MANQNEYDVIVIGGGPGGYVAAIRASQLGMRAAVIEKEHLGGICLNWGCIPTKALLRAAELRHNLEDLSDYGIEITGDITIDLEKVVKRSRGVASRLSAGVTHLLKKNKVNVIEGTASLKGKSGDKHIVHVAGDKPKDIQAKHVIIATGARARQIPNMEADGKQIVTYRDAMVPQTMPKSLIVVGLKNRKYVKNVI